MFLICSYAPRSVLDGGAGGAGVAGVAGTGAVVPGFGAFGAVAGLGVLVFPAHAREATHNASAAPVMIILRCCFIAFSLGVFIRRSRRRVSSPARPAAWRCCSRAFVRRRSSVRRPHGPRG